MRSHVQFSEHLMIIFLALVNECISEKAKEMIEMGSLLVTCNDIKT